jgi:hypothetical protein
MDEYTKGLIKELIKELREASRKVYDLVDEKYWDDEAFMELDRVIDALEEKSRLTC